MDSRIYRKPSEQCLIKKRISIKKWNYKKVPKEISGYKKYNNWNEIFTIGVKQRFEHAKELTKLKMGQLTLSNWEGKRINTEK